jgi:predicted O-methyltransferase YrrM
MLNFHTQPAKFPSPRDVYRVVAGYPNMSPEAGREIHELVKQERARYVLELGFNWGVSSCYIAAALRHNGGHLVTIDLTSRAAFYPGIERFLSQLGLDNTCTVFFETSTYNWRLREFLRMPEPPAFDLIFLDGAHLFEPDGLAFVLGERLLRGGGMFLFDDYRWTIQGSPHFQRNPGLVQHYSEQEKLTPHVKEVFELLVQPHPNIAETWLDGPWAFARKRADALPAQAAVPIEKLRAAAVDCRVEAKNRHPAAVHLVPAAKEDVALPDTE